MVLVNAKIAGGSASEVGADVLPVEGQGVPAAGGGLGGQQGGDSIESKYCSLFGEILHSSSW